MAHNTANKAELDEVIFANSYGLTKWQYYTLVFNDERYLSILRDTSPSNIEFAISVISFGSFFDVACRAKMENY